MDLDGEVIDSVLVVGHSHAVAVDLLQVWRGDDLKIYVVSHLSAIINHVQVELDLACLSTKPTCVRQIHHLDSRTSDIDDVNCYIKGAAVAREVTDLIAEYMNSRVQGNLSRNRLMAHSISIRIDDDGHNQITYVISVITPDKGRNIDNGSILGVTGHLNILRSNTRLWCGVVLDADGDLLFAQVA